MRRSPPRRERSGPRPTRARQWARAASVLLICLASVDACEARAPEPSAQHPIKTPAPAPAPAPTPASETADALPQIAGVHYLEFVTAGADKDAQLPMIIAIHGLGDSPEGLRGLLVGFDRPARVILPRGLDPHGPGWSWFPVRVRDVSEGNIEQLAASVERAANTLAPAIELLATERPTIGKPIVTGFSQGGMLSFTLAVQHPQLLCAALPIGGWLPDPLWPSAPSSSIPSIPIIAFHGDADTTVPYPATVAAVAHLEQAGYAVELRSYAGVGHSISRPMQADLFEALRTNLDRAQAPASE